jgi:hypothetical protein
MSYYITCTSHELNQLFGPYLDEQRANDAVHMMSMALDIPETEFFVRAFGKLANFYVQHTVKGEVKGPLSLEDAYVLVTKNTYQFVKIVPIRS